MLLKFSGHSVWTTYKDLSLIYSLLRPKIGIIAQLWLNDFEEHCQSDPDLSKFLLSVKFALRSKIELEQK